MSTNLATLPSNLPTSVEDRKPLFVDFPEYLINTAKKIEDINSDAELERLRLIVKMRKFYSGHQVGYVSKVDNRWVDKKKRGDALYVDPVLASFIDINVAQIVKSRPTLKVIPRSSDRVDKDQAALYAEELLKDAHARLFTAPFLQREAKLGLQLSGEAYRITWFDQKVRGTEVRIPVTETKTVQPKHDVWECAACGSSGPVDEGMQGQFLIGAVACPSCGYRKVDRVKAEPFEASVVTGYKEVPAGDVRCESPDPLEMKVIGGDQSIGEALAVTRDRLIMRGTLEQMYPGVKIPSTSTLPLKLKYSQDLKLDSPRSAGIRGDSGDSTAPTEGGEQFELLHFKEVWLDPAAYGGYEFQKNTTLPEMEKPKGKRTQVTKGTKLEDVANERGSFKDGAYYQKVGDLILDIFPCDKRKHLTHCVNNIGESFHGLGEWDLLPLQEQKNSLRSLMFAKEKFDALSPLLVRPDWVDPNKLAAAKNVPNAIVPVSNMPAEHPLDYAAARIQPGPAVVGSYKLDEILGQSMQYRTGASTLETGAPDMIGKNKTATATVAAQTQAEGRRGPMLQLRAEMEREQAYQILELRKENWPEQMYDALDRKVGGDAGNWFRQADIRRDFRIEVVPESWWPQTAEQRKADLAGLAVYADPQRPEVRKAIWDRATELYGRGLDLTSYQSDRVEARIRLERLRAVAEVIERSGVPVYGPTGLPAQSMINLAMEKAKLVPELGAIDPTGEPVVTNAILDRHDEYIEAYTSWLITSEGRAASPFTRAVINNVIVKHFDGKAGFAQFMDTQRMKANAVPNAIQEQQATEARAAEDAAAAEAQDAQEAAMIEQEVGKHALQQQDREHEAQTQMDLTEHKAMLDTLTSTGQPEPQT